MIEFVTGDIFNTDCDIIAHQVNCKGVMGAGIALSVKKRYYHVYDIYKQYCSSMPYEDLLGRTQLVDTKDGRYIANMFSQLDYGSGKKFTNYTAFETCCETLRNIIIQRNNNKEFFRTWSIAFPYKIGCNRGGGNWDIILKIIERYFGGDDIKCKIYKLDEVSVNERRKNIF